MKKGKIILDSNNEEQIEHDTLVKGGYYSVPNLAKEKEKMSAVAKNTFAKKRVITLRLTEANYRKIKAAAAREGLPYQTLITSLLHKHVS